MHVPGVGMPVLVRLAEPVGLYHVLVLKTGIVIEHYKDVGGSTPIHVQFARKADTQWVLPSMCIVLVKKI